METTTTIVDSYSNEEIAMSTNPIYVNMFNQLKEAAKNLDINIFKEFLLSFRTDYEQNVLRKLFINNRLFNKEGKNNLLMFMIRYVIKYQYRIWNDKALNLIKHIINDWEADVNLENKQGETALIICVMATQENDIYINILKFLIDEAKADVNIVDIRGHSALWHAENYDRNSFAYNLLIKESNVDTCCNSLRDGQKILFEKILKQREMEWAEKFFAPDGPGGQAMIKANNLLENSKENERCCNCKQ